MRLSDYPATPSQSGSAEVSTASLALFPLHTRPDTPDAPDYDWGRKTQYWADASAATRPADELIPYVVYLPRKGRMIQNVPAGDACRLNLPGVHAFPPFVPTPTTAYMVDPTSGAKTLIPLDRLCEESDAQVLASMWGGDFTIYEGTPAPTAHLATVYGSETRRQWYLRSSRFNGLLAGVYWPKQYEAGVGAPGHWDLTGGEPTWISDIPHTTGTPNEELLVPCRDLLANERCYFDFNGVGPVYRTDMPGPHNQVTVGNGVTTSAGAWTAGQVSGLLADVASLKRSVNALLGILNPPA